MERHFRFAEDLRVETAIVSAVATAVIIAIYSALISTWSGLNLTCLAAFGAIFLSYMFLLIRGDAMDLLA